MSRLYELFGVDFKKGDLIFQEGGEADALYMIHKGSIEIYKQSGDIRKRLQILGEGEFIGEMAVIDSLPRSANAAALEDCQLIRMDRTSFNNNIQENHQFSISVIQFLTKRLRDTNDKVISMSKELRSKNILLDLLNEFIAKGKKDRSGRWSLIEYDSLIADYREKYSPDYGIFLNTIDGFISGGIFEFKKDTRNKTWLAYKIY